MFEFDIDSFHNIFKNISAKGICILFKGTSDSELCGVCSCGTTINDMYKECPSCGGKILNFVLPLSNAISEESLFNAITAAEKLEPGIFIEIPINFSLFDCELNKSGCSMVSFTFKLRVYKSEYGEVVKKVFTSKIPLIDMNNDGLVVIEHNQLDTASNYIISDNLTEFIEKRDIFTKILPNLKIRTIKQAKRAIVLMNFFLKFPAIMEDLSNKSSFIFDAIERVKSLSDFKIKIPEAPKILTDAGYGWDADFLNSNPESAKIEDIAWICGIPPELINYIDSNRYFDSDDSDDLIEIIEDWNDIDEGIILEKIEFRNFILRTDAGENIKFILDSGKIKPENIISYFRYYKKLDSYNKILFDSFSYDFDVFENKSKDVLKEFGLRIDYLERKGIVPTINNITRNGFGESRIALENPSIDLNGDFISSFISLYKD